MLEIGGSQTNAIELAATVQNLGHEVIVFGPPGVLVQRVRELGLEFIPAPPRRERKALCELTRDRKVDLVHWYEFGSTNSGYFGPRAHQGVPLMVTVQSMAVPNCLPKDVPLIVGTAQIADYERGLGRSDVTVIEPPVDIRHNRPGVVSGQEFRKKYGLEENSIVAVCVGRLAAVLKLEGLLASIDAVEELAEGMPIQLAIVGDGAARSEIAQRAEQVNQKLGRSVVVLTGELVDPRPAYAAADIGLGMGSSALRAAAFGCPVVVQGEKGFWELLSPETSSTFLWTGMYGVGSNSADGVAKLKEVLQRLQSRQLRERLGEFSRRLVEENFALDRAGERLLGKYVDLLSGPPVRRRRVISSCVFAKRRAVQIATVRFLGKQEHDPNMTPVAATSPSTP